MIRKRAQSKSGTDPFPMPSELADAVGVLVTKQGLPPIRRRRKRASSDAARYSLPPTMLHKAALDHDDDGDAEKRQLKEDILILKDEKESVLEILKQSEIELNRLRLLVDQQTDFIEMLEEQASLDRRDIGDLVETLGAALNFMKTSRGQVPPTHPHYERALIRRPLASDAGEPLCFVCSRPADQGQGALVVDNKWYCLDHRLPVFRNNESAEFKQEMARQRDTPYFRTPRPRIVVPPNTSCFACGCAVNTLGPVLDGKRFCQKHFPAVTANNQSAEHQRSKKIIQQQYTPARFGTCFDCGLLRPIFSTVDGKDFCTRCAPQVLKNRPSAQQVPPPPSLPPPASQQQQYRKLNIASSPPTRHQYHHHHQQQQQQLPYQELPVTVRAASAPVAGSFNDFLRNKYLYEEPDSESDDDNDNSDDDDDDDDDDSNPIFTTTGSHSLHRLLQQSLRRTSSARASAAAAGSDTSDKLLETLRRSRMRR